MLSHTYIIAFIFVSDSMREMIRDGEINSVLDENKEKIISYNI